MLHPQSHHLLSHGVKAVVTQKGVPQFTSDFSEPQCQSCSGSLSLLDGAQVVSGAIWPLLCGPCIPHQQVCGQFWKQEDDADPQESVYRHRFLVLKPLSCGILR